jgi:hypothetical protein
VYVKRIDDFKVSVTYEGKTVMFNFFDAGTTPPKKGTITPNEVYVGPTFDESGLRFYLVFNNKVKKLYWVLNEDGFVPEEFTPYSKDVVIGDRTEFAFYNDTLNHRKIMIGANGMNVLANNWYDGPFDQMPDNYVHAGRIQVKKYLDEHYGFSPLQIDNYGKYAGKVGIRVPVAPYRVYFSKDEFKCIDSLKTLGLSTDRFYAKMTEQVYRVPKDYYEGVIMK